MHEERHGQDEGGHGDDDSPHALDRRLELARPLFRSAQCEARRRPGREKDCAQPRFPDVPCWGRPASSVDSEAIVGLRGRRQCGEDLSPRRIRGAFTWRRPCAVRCPFCPCSGSQCPDGSWHEHVTGFFPARARPATDVRDHGDGDRGGTAARASICRSRRFLRRCRRRRLTRSSAARPSTSRPS